MGSEEDAAAALAGEVVHQVLRLAAGAEVSASVKIKRSSGTLEVTTIGIRAGWGNHLATAELAADSTAPDAHAIALRLVREIRESMNREGLGDPP